MLDPDLQFYSGRYFPKDEKLNFGMFLDSCPDRWGRVLMERREAALAKIENRPADAVQQILPETRQQDAAPVKPAEAR